MLERIMTNNNQDVSERILSLELISIKVTTINNSTRKIENNIKRKIESFFKINLIFCLN